MSIHTRWIVLTKIYKSNMCINWALACVAHNTSCTLSHCRNYHVHTCTCTCTCMYILYMQLQNLKLGLHWEKLTYRHVYMYISYPVFHCIPIYPVCTCRCIHICTCKCIEAASSPECMYLEGGGWQCDNTQIIATLGTHIGPVMEDLQCTVHTVMYNVYMCIAYIHVHTCIYMYT